ncbi:probable clathrin-associated adaptor complex ap-1 small chain sigma1 [Ramularia collo-cygni]|uniref:AP-1 complex subunit sigma-1 n=1 Tax=Ramularia collo-cygni TaxID=112498 RepID=A0A2D3UN15_9PEZI|nr:probable clathrin-associated adaptor complex ap-1 small chain sigma1 [Ramularia collo-cygni]CZT17172.1 probable clathrin-associated adaptor complex ap-1 small chain sigma1 [Ramularia collo-cygni]
MAIKYIILLSRQGKVRLAKWFTTLSPKDKAKIVKDVTQLVLARRTRSCNFLEYRDTKVVYRRYASLFFIAATDNTDNELITLEIVHRYVEQMDKYYGNVCELDIIFNFQKAYFILDELLLAGEMQESSKKNVLRVIGAQDSLEEMESRTMQSRGSAECIASCSCVSRIVVRRTIAHEHADACHPHPDKHGDERRARNPAQERWSSVAAEYFEARLRGKTSVLFSFAICGR